MVSGVTYGCQNPASRACNAKTKCATSTNQSQMPLRMRYLSQKCGFALFQCDVEVLLQNFKTKCGLPKHEQHGLSVKDFEKPKNAVTDVIDYIQIISSIPDENEEATRDSLMANALALDLIPEGNVPRDGNCMFHAVAHGLSVNGNSVNQEEVRNAAAKWLEDNQLINGDVHLPDFLYGMGWEQNNIVGQPCIFLGHEFETHYIRLVPLYETVPMLQSHQQTVEDQGGAGYAKLNSDIRDASEDDQPCADNVGTANEKQSIDSFGESVDDQQCAGNRRKADENEQYTCGICHVVDDLQSEYSRSATGDHRSEDSRRATGDHRSEDYLGAADDHRSEDNRGAADDHRSEDSRGVADDLRSEYSRGAADDHRSEDSRGAADDHRAEDNRGAADSQRSEDSRGTADDDQQSVDVRNEECGNRQLAYCTRPSNICDLPDEILHLIFEHVASGGGTNIGLMRNTWTDSLRVQCLLNDVTHPMVHIGEDIMRCLGGGASSLWSGVEYRVTIYKLIRMAGKFSGLAVRLKELFFDHPRWYESVICLVTTGLPGWLNVRDFVPPKGC